MHPRTQSCRRAESERRTHHLSDHKHPEYPLLVVPDVADNSSMRQAQARLLAAGFKLSENEHIAGEKDWVYGVKYKGRTLTNGEKVPVGATLTLIVGDGGELPQEGDSTAVEATTPTSSKDSAADESWF